MQISLIKEIVSNIIGKEGEKIVDILYKKKNVNEFIISKKLNLTINQTRNLLYKLSDRGLIHFIRKKDSKKGGWYTYYWTLSIKKSVELLKEQMQHKIETLQNQLQKKRNERFYYSPGSGLEYTEEEALENNFICPETGEVLGLKDNKELVDSLDIEISKLKLLIEEVSLELQDIEKKRNKEKDRKFRIEIKKKEVERKVRRKKMKRKREKEAKEEIKKKSDKKEKKKLLKKEFPKKIEKKKAGSNKKVKKSHK